MFNLQMECAIDMKDVLLDNKFFVSCDLQHNLPDANPVAPQADLDAWVARQKQVVVNYNLLKSKAEELFGDRKSTCNEHSYDEAISLFERAEAMCKIQSLWSQEDDYASDDDWFLTRANDYIHALYTQPTDQLASFVPTIGLRGKYLTHGSYKISGLRLRNEIDYRHPDMGNFGDLLFLENMVVPFDAHSIWDALLLLLSRQWMWKPEMWFVAALGGKVFYPRITIYGQQALATFCSVSATRGEEEKSFSIHKNGVLLNRIDDTFSIAGAYRVRIGDTEEPCLPEPPKQIPLFHLFTEEEQYLIKSARCDSDDDLPF